PTASHHYAFTWEREGEQVVARLYIDGELQGETLGDWHETGDTVFIAGGVADTGGNNHLGTGIFDEFRIYNQALSEEEILNLSMFAPETMDTLTGDFNGDGIVDAADYTVWRDNLGSPYTQAD